MNLEICTEIQQCVPNLVMLHKIAQIWPDLPSMSIVHTSLALHFIFLHDGVEVIV